MSEKEFWDHPGPINHRGFHGIFRCFHRVFICFHMFLFPILWLFNVFNMVFYGFHMVLSSLSRSMWVQYQYMNVIHAIFKPCLMYCANDQKDERDATL